MNKIPLNNTSGKRLGDYEISDRFLILDKGSQAVHEAVVAYQAHQRAGTASTLSKSFVNGSGRKPWKQKGLGRARAGYRQSPIWRGGAVAHGPHPRKYKKKVSRKVAKLAFRHAFSTKVDRGEITMIDELELSAPKTRDFSAILKNLDLIREALFIVDEVGDNLLLASRNIPRVKIVTAQLVNTYQMLRHRAVIVTQTGMEALEKRLV